MHFLVRLPFFLRRPISIRDAEQVIELRLRDRENLFLDLVRRTIYGFPQSPYRRLLDWAGCEAGDLKNLVSKEGVEGALTALYRQGVCLTIDEFKGRKPVVRGSANFEFHPHLFQNPILSHHLRIRTSGSRNPGIPVPVNFAYIRSRCINALLGLTAQGGIKWLHALWGIPGGSALIHLLEFSGFGVHPARWFSQVDPASHGLHARYLWSAKAARWASFLAGVPLPRIQHAPACDPGLVLNWIIETLRSGRVPHLLSYVSSVVRLCQAAKGAGAEIKGARFTVIGEPVTPERLAIIRQAGAEAFPRYGSAECGTIGYACLAPDAPDEVHFLHDRLALIQEDLGNERRRVPARTLFISTLDPATPFILLNVSLGDQAVVLKRNCGCPLQNDGWTTHLHSIRSNEKLTSGGMSFLDTDIIRILEKVLPDRFGGGPTHYQLTEDIDQNGLSTLELRVHPAVGPVESKAVAETFFAAIGSNSGGPSNGIERIIEHVWRDGGLLRVVQSPPLSTNSGKILHFHVSQPQP